MNRLSLTGICKQYPGWEANNGIDLSVQPGEIHALLGENGAGKSTLMRSFIGQLSRMLVLSTGKVNQYTSELDD